MDRKQRQLMYHMVSTLTDTIGVPTFQPETDQRQIICDVIDYFTLYDPPLKYPAKSYAVAIIYARLISKHFKEPFYSVLDDPMLLYGNDYFFKPYSHDKQTYDRIIASIPHNVDSIALPQVIKTIEYFTQEFLLNEIPIDDANNEDSDINIP